MSISKSTRRVSTHASSRKGGANKPPLPPDPESLIGYAKLLKLRSRAESTQKDYRCYMRRVAARHGSDPAGLDEAQGPMAGVMRQLSSREAVMWRTGLRRRQWRWRAANPSGTCHLLSDK